MALFNNINRRIKSMQEGGRPFVMPEVDDGSIGGFNRPELRGLRKQARRGTLTNRERRRLNYLTNEAKGRRRRGLLSGLGGAAAALGTAALIKSGGAKGLMDSIKSRISGEKGQEKLDAFNEANRLKNQQALDAQLESGEIDQTTYDRQTAELEGAEGVTSTRDLRRIQRGKAPKEGPYEGQDVSLPGSMTTMEEILAGESDGKGRPVNIDELEIEDADIPLEEEEDLGGPSARDLMSDVEMSRNVIRGGSGGESFGKGQTYSAEEMMEALSNAKTPEEQKMILDKIGDTGSTPNPKAMERLEEEIEKTIGEKRGFKTVPVDPDNPYSVKNRKTVMEGSSGPLDPDDFSPQEGGEVDLPSDTERLLQDLSKGIDPAVLGAVRGGGGESLLSKIDPEGLVQEGGEEGAIRMLQALNEGRKSQGLPPVDKLTKEAIKEGNMAAGPQRLKPLQAGTIERPEDPFAGQLPIARAQELLQPFLPSGRRRTMNVGGMVKRMMQRYK